MSGRVRYLKGLRNLQQLGAGSANSAMVCVAPHHPSDTWCHLCYPSHEAEEPIDVSRSWICSLQVEQRSPVLIWDDTERFEFLTTFETVLCRKNTVFNLLLDRKETDDALSLRGLFLEEFILLYFTGKLICSLGSWVEDRHCLAVACLIIPCNFDWQWNTHWKAAGSVC